MYKKLTHLGVTPTIGVIEWGERWKKFHNYRHCKFESHDVTQNSPALTSARCNPRAGRRWPVGQLCREQLLPPAYQVSDKLRVRRWSGKRRPCGWRFVRSRAGGAVTSNT